MSTPKTHTVNYTATVRGTATYEVREDGTVLIDSSVPIEWDYESLDNIVEWDARTSSDGDCDWVDNHDSPDEPTPEELNEVLSTFNDNDDFPF